MIQIKSEAELATMREAGLVTAAALAAVREVVAPGLSTQDLDKVAEDVIRGAGGIPSFVGYHGFPATLCTSVNDEIVHGIPSPGRVLKDGDLVSIDCGAIVDGFHGDSAITVGIGEIS
ncbi:MAG: methionyl aminopeptidase, partial [Frankiales bacterium]|nr:methionyl aminopeptidase [Frankiales bacterium]